MEVDPGRRQSLAVVASVSAAVVLCLGALLWSFINPSGRINASPIIADKDSGALYVRVGDRLHPALNLASARLIAGRPDNPHAVRASQIAALPHGPMVGIPGAPSSFSPQTPPNVSWLVCDTVGRPAASTSPSGVTVTVIDGSPDLGERHRVLGGVDTVVLRYGVDAWAIRQGHRSRIAPDRAVLLPLGLTPEQVGMARPMSQALFNALPVGPELTVPAVRNAGAPAAFPGAPGVVGTVLVTPQVSGPQQFSLVLTNGVQTLPPLVAQILQNAGATGPRPVTIEPAALAKMPLDKELDLSPYPDTPFNAIDTQDNPATCWWWQKAAGENRARAEVVTGPTVPISQDDMNNIVPVVKTDVNALVADQVYFGRDFANFTMVTGNDAAASTNESLWWLSDTGSRFGVEDTREVRDSLGLQGTPSPAPWVALRLLLQGPTLSRPDALVTHGTLPADMSPAELTAPR